jgi:hypothetical protein
MDLDEELEFDVVVTDAFLTRFSPQYRTKITSKWHRLLRSGGKVITTVRIEPGVSGDSISATPEQADAFRRRALIEARRWQSFIGVQPEVIAQGAQRYAERMTSYSFQSEEEVERLFTDSGFRIESLQICEVPGEMSSTNYAEIIAERE